MAWYLIQGWIINILDGDEWSISDICEKLLIFYPLVICVIVQWSPLRTITYQMIFYISSLSHNGHGNVFIDYLQLLFIQGLKCQLSFGQAWIQYEVTILTSYTTTFECLL